MTPIYHITDFRNLASISNSGGLYCDRFRLDQGMQCIGIAHQHIKDRRARRKVPTAKFGTLADYVPFYFAPRSPMLFTIHRGNVEGYGGDQRAVVHLVTAAESIAKAGLPFAFTDGYAVKGFSEFFDDLADLTRQSGLGGDECAILERHGTGS